MRKMKRFGFCYPMDTKVFDTPGTTTPDPWLPNVAESVLPMVEDEFKEVHLQAALASKSLIPIPDVIEIDEEIYGKLYQKSQGKMPAEWIRTRENALDIVDYDLDDSDIKWLEQRPEERNIIKAEQFEEALEFLENRIKELKTVATLEDLEGSRIIKNPKLAEEVFDYWLDKRLTLKHGLMYRLKKPQVNNFDDPYVAFVPRIPKKMMMTRKDRTQKHKKYVEQFQQKARLDIFLKELEGFKMLEDQRHASLIRKASEFEVQYQTKQLQIGFLDRQLMRLPQGKESVELYPFICQPGSEYITPIESGIYGIEDAKENFHSTTIGNVRRRLGRGGRMILDRMANRNNQQRVPEFQQVDINPKVIIKRSPPSLMPGSSTSVFRLTDVPSIAVELDSDIEFIMLKEI